MYGMDPAKCLRIRWAVLGEGKCMVDGPDWENVGVHDPGDLNSNDSSLNCIVLLHLTSMVAPRGKIESLL